MEWFKRLFRKSVKVPICILCVEDDLPGLAESWPDLCLSDASDLDDEEIQEDIYAIYEERGVIAVIPTPHTTLHVPHDMQLLLTAAFAKKPRTSVH